MCAGQLPVPAPMLYSLVLSADSGQQKESKNQRNKSIAAVGSSGKDSQGGHRAVILVPWCGTAPAEGMEDADRGKAVPTSLAPALCQLRLGAGVSLRLLLLLFLPLQEWVLMGRREWAANQLLPHPFPSRKPIETSQEMPWKSLSRGKEAARRGEAPAPNPCSEAGNVMHEPHPCLRAVPPKCHPQAASAPGTLCSYLRLNTHFSSSVSQLGLDQSWKCFMCAEMERK